MHTFTIVPLSKEYAQRVRETGQDEFGHSVVAEPMTGTGPCRVTLRQLRAGIDKRLVVNHTPFEKDNAYYQRGPIFISADEVEEYADIHRWPPEIKHVTLIGYNADQQMIYTRVVGETEDINEVIPRIFYGDMPQVAYLHARSTRAACFICRIERG
jgi:hypothetical protein